MKYDLIFILLVLLSIAIVSAMAWLIVSSEHPGETFLYFLVGCLVGLILFRKR